MLIPLSVMWPLGAAGVPSLPWVPVPRHLLSAKGLGRGVWNFEAWGFGFGLRASDSGSKDFVDKQVTRVQKTCHVREQLNPKSYMSKHKRGSC